MHNFKELKIWQYARVLVKKAYLLAGDMPKDEKYGLISQIQRAAVSIPLNIAEGSGKSSNKDFCRFLEMSLSSAFELETLIILSNDLGLISDQKHDEILNDLKELQKMIYGYIKTLKYPCLMVLPILS